MPTRHPPETEPHIPHNLGLYRLTHFSGRREELRTLHTWLTQPGENSALAITGSQGNGKSTLASAAAWANIRHFSDGVIWVGPAGQDRFRLYDIVRTLDTVLGTTISGMSVDRWDIAILEQLYRRKRLLILDELSGATETELRTLVEIISRLRESGSQSRVLLINRTSNPMIADLVHGRELMLAGLTQPELPAYIAAQAPGPVQPIALEHLADLHRVSGGSPLGLRLLFGMMLDYAWSEIVGALGNLSAVDGTAPVQELASLAVASFAAVYPQASSLMAQLVNAAGGATFTALRQLFWAELGDQPQVEQLLADLVDRGLLEEDTFRQRVIIQPAVRRFLVHNAAQMGDDWLRRHAIYYQQVAEGYQRLPLEQWQGMDVEWGNVHYGADWCLDRARELWGADPPEMVDTPLEKQADFGPPAPRPDLGNSVAEMKEELRLIRNYALNLAPYGFWRHPPGIVRWLAAGAVASLALRDVGSYGWLIMNIGRQYFFQGDIDKAVGYLSRALVIFEDRDMLLNQAYAHTDLGTAKRILNQLAPALDHFWNAFECVAQLGNQRELATAYINLGSAYFSMQNYTRALEHHRKGLRIAQRLGDGQRVASAYNNIGLVLESKHELHQAHAAYQQALDGFQQVNDLLGISTCYNNLGSVGYSLKNHPQALMWYELDLALSARRGAWLDMAATLHNLGHVALEQQEWQQAASYFAASRDLYAAFRLEEYVREEEEMLDFIGQHAPVL
ncbi:MAG: tetratricopeptide repeat protein [Caldilineaceae bacterium]|nr:tetratricopeptide repeat protein [Caldilineaceae bacterium]